MSELKGSLLYLLAREPLYLRHYDRFVAVRADAVAELQLRVSADVAFDLLPVILIVADFFAVRADGQNPL